jgi:hypothetical protein
LGSVNSFSLPDPLPCEIRPRHEIAKSRT